MMDLYKSTNGDNIYINILDLDNITEQDFEKFMYMYNKSEPDLCIGRVYGNLVKSESIYNYIPKIYSEIKAKYPNQKIFYLYKLDKSEKTIIGFSVIDESEIKKNIVHVKLLCSHKIKYYIKLNNDNILSIGKFLLNQIYNFYHSKYNIHIFPASEFLEAYYIDWKTPNRRIKNKQGLQDTLIYTIHNSANGKSKKKKKLKKPKKPKKPKKSKKPKKY